MRICILSMQRVCNFGSVLQSYSLKKILTELGHEVEFIDIDSNNRDLVISGDEGIRFAEDIDGFSKHALLGRLKKININLPLRVRNKFIQKRQIKMFLAFQNRVLKLDSNKNTEYDLCVIGSDEVFNCLQADDISRTTQLFGNVRQASRVITYAASCGFCTYDKLSPEMKQRISHAFSKVERFSVRDKNTKEFVSKLTGRSDISENFDPVFIGNFDKEISRVKLKKEMPENYCLVYAYPNRIHSKEEIREIKKFCREKKLNIVAIGMQQSWIRDYRVMNPFELLYAFKNADYVITDTFHGAIFSAKYAKKYSIILRDSNRNKLGDLIERLDIEKHVICSMKELDDNWQYSENKERIILLEKKGRQETINYLKSAL